MSKRSFRNALVALMLTVTALAVAGYIAVRAVIDYPGRAHEGSGRKVTVKITKGMRFPDVAELMAKEGLVDRPTWFRLYAMHRGLANKVRAGTYELPDNLPPRELLDLLVKGVEEVDVAVTIPEGRNFREVFAIIEQAGIVEAAALEALARDAAWLKGQGIEGSVEGYLFPDTYRWKKPSSAKLVLETMVKQHRIVYDTLRKEKARSLEKLQKQLGWGDREVVIMASIVEKEAVAEAERTKISSVFYNRLLLPTFTSHRLETDPTIRYGCQFQEPRSKACATWDPAGRLFRAQLDDAENRYNTYQHAGLPPGPIGNPGRASIAAAMAPDTTPYLFFVAKDPRNHVFSKTFEEHNRNVQKYQK